MSNLVLSVNEKKVHIFRIRCVRLLRKDKNKMKMILYLIFSIYIHEALLKSTLLKSCSKVYVCVRESSLYENV